MTASTEIHARLSDDSYERDGFHPPSPYEVVRVIESPTGYRGIIYQHTVTDDYVVAHTGTEFDVDKLRDVGLTDAQMVLLKANQQLDDARQTVELALAQARRDSSHVTLTGHSLGGFLTQVTSHEYGLRGETFNAYGAAGLYGVPKGGDLVVNHVRATDMVAAANHHFGQTRIYATARDVEVLFADHQPPSQNSPREFIRDVARLNPDQTHNAVQFHNGTREPEQLRIYGPASIIDTDNQVRYQQHKAEFDHYRETIRVTAKALATGFQGTAPGALYSAAIGSQHVQHKIRGAVLGSEVLDEIHKLRQEERAGVNERNRHFEAPATPRIYRGRDLDPMQRMHEHADDLRRAPTLEDSLCRPPPGSGWPTSAARPPTTLRDDPLAYMNHMIAAFDGGDMDSFRRMTHEAAKDPFAQQMQTRGAAVVDREEQLLAQQQLVEQQRQEQIEQEANAVRGPRLRM